MNADERAYYRRKATEERDRCDFVAALEANEHVHDVSERRKAVDFYVGDPRVYPDHFDDDHLNVVGRSSVSTHRLGAIPEGNRFVAELKVHLPPAPEELREPIDDALDLPDGTAVHYGTGALGGMPAPEGVVTPHVLHTENLPFGAAGAVVATVTDAYETVYDAGERAIKTQPEDHR